MPALNGFETARLIRERKRSRHTPIIFVTAPTAATIRTCWRPTSWAPSTSCSSPSWPRCCGRRRRSSSSCSGARPRWRRQATLLREHERREHEHSPGRGARGAGRRSSVTSGGWSELAEEAAAQGRVPGDAGARAAQPAGPHPGRPGGSRSAAWPAPEVDPLVRRTRDRIERQVEHLRRLVDDLLDVSRISSGKIELRKAPVCAAVDRRRRGGHRPAGHRGAPPRAGHRLPGPVPTLCGRRRPPDPGVRQPARTTPPATPTRAAASRCAARPATAGWRSRVIDNGRGIPPELLPRIFDMFVQERPGGGGLGLGLTVVERLVELHGGSVQARSEGPGRGSDVRRAPAPLAEEAPEPGRRGGGRAPRRRRERAGPWSWPWSTTTRTSARPWPSCSTVGPHGRGGRATARAAIELILRLRPDVALVDISMPELDGYAVARRLRQELGEACPRLVAMSGYGSRRTAAAPGRPASTPTSSSPSDSRSSRRRFDADTPPHSSTADRTPQGRSMKNAAPGKKAPRDRRARQPAAPRRRSAACAAASSTCGCPTTSTGVDGQICETFNELAQFAGSLRAEDRGSAPERGPRGPHPPAAGRRAARGRLGRLRRRGQRGARRPHRPHRRRGPRRSPRWPRATWGRPSTSRARTPRCAATSCATPAWSTAWWPSWPPSARR